MQKIDAINLTQSICSQAKKNVAEKGLRYQEEFIQALIFSGVTFVIIIFFLNITGLIDGAFHKPAAFTYLLAGVIGYFKTKYENNRYFEATREEEERLANKSGYSMSELYNFQQ